MAKKKQKKQGQQFLSPEQYIKQKARSLEASRYLPLLEMNLGKDNFDYILNADDEDWDDDLDDCILDIHDRFEDMHHKFARNE